MERDRPLEADRVLAGATTIGEREARSADGGRVAPAATVTDRQKGVDMTGAGAPPHPEAQAQGPKFFVNVEGTVYPWDHDTITVPQIRELGSLPPDTPVLQIDL